MALKKILLFAALGFFLLTAALLVALLINPAAAPPRVVNSSRLTLYLDVSASHYSHNQALKNFLSQLEQAWPGSLRVRHFGAQLLKRSFSLAETQRALETELEGKQIALNALSQQTSLAFAEQLSLFPKSQTLRVVLSDFIAATPLDVFSASAIPPKKTPPLLPAVSFVSLASNAAPEIALSFKKKQVYYFTAGENTFELQLYAKNFKRSRHRLRLFLDRAEKGLAPSLLYDEPVFISNRRSSVEVSIELPERLQQQAWITLRAALSRSGRPAAEAHLNLLSLEKKPLIQFVFNGATRDGFLLKRAAESYYFFATSAAYFFTPPAESQLLALIRQKKGAFFVLVAPTEQTLAVFRNSGAAFLHLPAARPSTPLVSRSNWHQALDYNYSFINFSGRAEESRLHWERIAPQTLLLLEGPDPQRGPATYYAAPQAGASFFFSQGRETYLGIKQLHRLDEPFLSVSSSSLVTIFTIKLLRHLTKERQAAQQTTPHNNYFLGDKIAAENTPPLPHLLTMEEGFAIAPLRSKKGLHPTKTSATPPFNYRLPFEEFVPHSAPPASVFTPAAFFKALAQWQTAQQTPSAQQPPPRIRLRAFSWPYLLLLLCFSLALLSKALYLQLQEN